MMKRRIFPWMGLIVLFIIFGLSQEILAKEYKVRHGDTLAKIAKRTGVTTQALREANGLKRDALKLKQVLIIPDKEKNSLAKSEKQTVQKTEYYIVAKGDTLQSIAKKTGCSVKEIRQWNHVRSQRLKTGQKLVFVSSRHTGKSTAVKNEEADQLAEIDDTLDEETDPSSEDLSPESDQKAQSDATPLGSKRIFGCTLSIWRIIGQRT
jgi:LysM repeat protein